MIIVAEYIFAGAEKGWISAIFAISSLQKTKIAFEGIEFSKCLGKWKCDFIAVLDLKSIFSLVCFSMEYLTWDVQTYSLLTNEPSI